MRLPLRLPLDMLALFVELLKGHFANAGAIIRAYTWLVTHPMLILRKRKLAQARRRVSDRMALKKMYRGSIVFEYFLLKKQRFNELLFHKKLL